MKQITFERIMLLIIAVGIWTAIVLHIINMKSTKDVYVVNTIDAEIRNEVGVSVNNEVDVNLNNVLGDPIGTHTTYVDKYGIQHWGIDVVEY